MVNYKNIIKIFHIDDLWKYAYIVFISFIYSDKIALGPQRETKSPWQKSGAPEKQNLILGLLLLLLLGLKK